MEVTVWRNCRKFSSVHASGLQDGGEHHQEGQEFMCLYGMRGDSHQRHSSGLSLMDRQPARFSKTSSFYFYYACAQSYCLRIKKPV